jgi:uncharacterized protein YjbI with pentapeptide repeats
MLKAGEDLAEARQAFADLAALAIRSSAARQRCADEMCAWLRAVWSVERRPDTLDRDVDSLAHEVAEFVAAHLVDPTAGDTFCGLDLDFSRTAIRNLSFNGAHFPSGTVDFRNCAFDEKTSFIGARFSGARVRFDGSTFQGAGKGGNSQFANAVFAGSEVSFSSSEFRNGITCFDDTQFTRGEVRFDRVKLTDSHLSFVRSKFSGAVVAFSNALINSGTGGFFGSMITGGKLDFHAAKIHASLSFEDSVIDGGELSFDEADVGQVVFNGVKLLSGSMTMRNIFASGGRVQFDGMMFAGGEFSLEGARIPFGSVLLDKASFLAGTVSLERVVIEFEGVLDLPWGRYTGSGGVVKDEGFDGLEEHDFYVKVARYVPDVNMQWGSFRPGGAGQGRVRGAP